MALPGSPLHGIDRAHLRPLVRQVLGAPGAEVESWQAHTPPGWSAGVATRGLFRITGGAKVDGARVSWSLVLKVLHSQGRLLRTRGFESEALFREDPAQETYWRREILAYQSGWLAELPGGLCAPRCFALEFPRDEEARLWLEDVPDELPGAWPLNRYAEVARELGRFNGAYLVQRPLPSEPWLVRGWLRSWVAFRAAHLELIADPRAWEHPLLAGCFAKSTRARILELWEGREVWLDALDRLPHTLCHRDAHPANLLTRTGTGGRLETVAVDWAHLSLAPLGAEAQALVGGAGVTQRAPSGQLEDLDGAVAESYQMGLEDMGLRPDPRVLRFAFAASASLQWTFGTTGLLLGRLARLARTSKAGLAPEGLTQEGVADRARVIRYFLDLAAEAQLLLPGS